MAEHVNPIVKLADIMQKLYRDNISIKIVRKADKTKATITLPNGNTYSSSDENKVLAKRKCAKKALKAEGLI